MSHVLHLGDCLEGMAGLADKSVDHVICDPPFTQRTSEGARTGDGKAGRYIVFDGIDGLETKIVAECLRVARRWCVWFCAFEQLGAYQTASSDLWVRAGVWRKPDSKPQITGDRPSMCGEAVAIAHAAGRKRWNGRGSPAFWEYGTERHRDPVGHPTQKPLDLMERIVRDFTDPGELVCDPFAGSGTTGVACKRLGRNFIGWEKDPKFHAAAVKRIEAAREQFQLPRLPKAKQTGMVLHAPNSAEAVDAQTNGQPVDP